MTLKNLSAVGAIAAALSMGLSPLAASAAILDAHVGVSASTTVDGAHVGADARIASRIEDAKAHGDKEIDRRIANLNELIARISDKKRLSGDDQAALTTSIQTQISDLTSLKAKIDADDSTTTLKADIKSITDGYRIYMLVMPQAAITAAGERVIAVASLMEQLSAKLSARIDAASTTDKASLAASLTDYNAKVADAKAQAQAAIDAVAALKPDNGDKTVAKANLDALKAARAKVQAAQQDLVAARKDAGAIIKGVGGGKASVNVHANATTSAEVH